MNREEVNREKVIQTVREATTLPETLSSTSMKTIKRVAEEYGEQQQRVDDVNHWFNKLKNKTFYGTRADTEEWLDNWLSELP
jgi:hypothetical protein